MLQVLGLRPGVENEFTRRVKDARDDQIRFLS
jgi:hypothetical protein